MKPQCMDILRHMEEHGSITDLDAYTVYHIRRLASRIYDLKALYGIDVGKVTERGKNADGVPVNYARYFLKEATNGNPCSHLREERLR